MRWTRDLVAVALAALAVTGCAQPNDEGDSPVPRAEPAGAWRRLPDAPLTPRDHAVVVGVGDRMLVVGGWEFLCPPMGDCSTPHDPLLDDGAVYDPGTDTWHPIAPAPFGLRRDEYATATVDGTAFLLTSCANGPGCDARPRLLSYHLADDRWMDHGPVPGPSHDRHLAAVEEDLLVYSGSDEHGEVADLVFDPRRSTWTELPDDPLPATFDRFVVPVAGRLVLTGSPSAALASGTDHVTLAARLDLATGTWTVLPDAPGPGYQLLPSSNGPLLNGHFIESGGWILDPGTWTWAELPDPPGGHADLRGVLDPDGATYDIPNSVGQMASSLRLYVYDVATKTFMRVPAPPGREAVYDDSSTALGRDLFVYGGQRWTGEGLTGDGELVGDAWVWAAPAG